MAGGTTEPAIVAVRDSAQMAQLLVIASLYHLDDGGGHFL